VPFTISHAAAVLPLQKTRLPLAALMIGSMSPDFAYFLPGDPDRIFTHSFAGLFWFCWPVSLVAWGLFVRVLEQPTFALLPENWRARFAASDREFSFRALALTSLAILVGAITHLIWDSFTHRGTGVVGALPGLHAIAFYFHGWPIRWFVVLQHLSSVIGMLILMIWLWRLPAIHTRTQTFPWISHSTRVRAASILIASSLAFAVTRYALNLDTWFARRLFHLAIGGMTGWIVAWFAIALWVTSRSHRADREPRLAP
jgi:uncharacterized protein DUF4184